MVKKTVVGRGAALKPQVGLHGRPAAAAAARRRSPADAADGVAVALTHLLRRRRRGRSGAAGAAMIATVSRRARGTGRRHDRGPDRRRGGLRGDRAARRASSGCRRPAARCASTPSWWCGRTAGRSSASTGRSDRPSSSGCCSASGFGPRLALALLSTLGPERAVREHPGQGHRRPGHRERHRPKEGGAAGPGAVRPVRRPRGSRSGRPSAGGGEEAVRALPALGYAPARGRRGGARRRWTTDAAPNARS